MGSHMPNHTPDLAGMDANLVCAKHPDQTLEQTNQTSLCRQCLRENEQIAALGLLQLHVGYPDLQFDEHNAHHSCKECMLATLEEAGACARTDRCFYHPNAAPVDQSQAVPCEECRREAREAEHRPHCRMHPDVRRRPGLAYCYRCEVHFRRSRIRCGWRSARYSLAEMRADVGAMEDFLLACERQRGVYFPDVRGDPTVANTKEVLAAMHFLKARFEELGEIPAHAGRD
ncbi:hypothetical protein GGTG_12699 [Gaeumannomyces tritici R3-111a-1]|uniref:Uncharacterized protein n=1 Tax=Gaeumannomyces tritici (strain R3-111a-1) TaxID=644352 RepID=J3PGS0_GAET3|nr:hypothetical protein GGTG_12699 [Gaeumannomyces tritici R3-111a-1]EJT69816.1 hypothetical protein GGTG_12699 [Gaeumannomyces tritici R3-111a-1]